jgi:hypothetical protein
MSEWVKMTPQQRRLARENYQITRSLPAEKKAEAWDKYQQLPEEQKKKLAATDHVPRRPGAVSALPSGKRLPSETSREFHREPKTASAAAGHSGHTAGKPASEAQAQPASAPAAVTAAPAPAASAPAALGVPASAAEVATEAAAAASDPTMRQ